MYEIKVEPMQEKKLVTTGVKAKAISCGSVNMGTGADVDVEVTSLSSIVYSCYCVVSEYGSVIHTSKRYML